MELTHPATSNATFPDDISDIYCGNVKHIRPKWLYERDRNRSKELLNFEYKRNKTVPPFSNIKAICKKRAWDHTSHISTFIKKGIKDKCWFKKREQLPRSRDEGAIIQLIKAQDWPGLVIVDTQDSGKGVVTRKQFHINETVCDYHGIDVRQGRGKVSRH